MKQTAPIITLEITLTAREVEIVGDLGARLALHTHGDVIRVALYRLATMQGVPVTVHDFSVNWPTSRSTRNT